MVWKNGVFDFASQLLLYNTCKCIFKGGYISSGGQGGLWMSLDVIGVLAWGTEQVGWRDVNGAWKIHTLGTLLSCFYNETIDNW